MMRPPVALVTGASSGIGRAIAVCLAADGFDLILSGRNAAALEGLGLEVGAKSRQAWRIAGDLRAASTRDRLAAAAAAAGGIRALIHSAGIHAAATVGATTEAGVSEVLAVDLTVPHLLTARLIEHFVADAPGDLVFVNSTQALAAGAGAAAYAAAKHGLRGLADALRAELNPRMRVLSVFCGRTETPMQQRIEAAAGRDLAIGADRMIRPEDVASAVRAALALDPRAEITELTIRPRLPPDRSTG